MFLIYLVVGSCIFIGVVLLYAHTQTQKNVQAQHEALVKIEEEKAITQEVATEIAEETKQVVKTLAIIKDPENLWIVDNLRGETERSGIPNTIALSLQKPGDARMALHVPYFLQEMHKGGFTIIGDGKQSKFGESKLLFCFEEAGEGERFVVVMEELLVHPDMVHKTRYLETEKVNLADWVEFQGYGEGKHLLGANVILHMNADCDTDCRTECFSKIRNHLSNSRVEVKYPTVANQFAMNRPVERNGHVILDRVQVKTNPLPEKIMSLSYPEALVNGLSMTLSVLFDKLVKLVAVGRFNAIVTGQAGWGKSQLAKYLARLLHASGVTTVISEDSFPMEKTIDLLRQRLVTETAIFWIVEDAHRLSLSDLAALLNFMEGATTPTNLSTMVLYNPKECDPDHTRLLNEALGRPGRATIRIDTEELKAAKATELKDTILALMPELVERGPWVEGDKSLASVWAHMVPKVEKEIFG